MNVHYANISSFQFTFPHNFVYGPGHCRKTMIESMYIYMHKSINFGCETINIHLLKTINRIVHARNFVQTVQWNLPWM